MEISVPKEVRDLETRVDVSSSDEIGLLGENFNYMADQLVVLLRHTAEKARTSPSRPRTII